MYLPGATTTSHTYFLHQLALQQSNLAIGSPKLGQEKKEITYILWKHIFHCHPSRMPPPRHEALPPRPLGRAGRSARARTARSTASGGGGEPCAPKVRHQGVQMIAGASFTIKPQRDLLKIQDFHGFLGWQTVDNMVKQNMISRIASA